MEDTESALSQTKRDDSLVLSKKDAISSRILTIPSIIMNDENVNCFPTRRLGNSKGNTSRKCKKGRMKNQDIARALTLVATAGQEKQVDNVMCNETTASSERRLGDIRWFKSSSAKASTPRQRHSVMERADVSPYSSDVWEVDSVESDTDDDHTDSSDDDDPKSQVDRLIERGTLMYVDGENSALSSEGETDDEEEDYDSESDITDVSPLVSATASPLGLSPVLPRRTIPTSPLALHDNRELLFRGSADRSGSDYMTETNWTDHRDESNAHSTDMDLLLRAVIELESKSDEEKFRLSRPHKQSKYSKSQKGTPGLSNSRKDQNMFLHPVRDNPHHHHLRKNMSFSNEEVRKIDRENKIILKKIMAAHSRKNLHDGDAPQRPHKPSNSAVNRRKGEERMRKENLLLLKKIQEAKPSKDLERVSDSSMVGVTESRFSPISSSNLRSPTRSCGALMRSIIAQPPLVSVPSPRKETAL